MNYNLLKLPKRMIMGVVYQGENDTRAMAAIWETFYDRIGEIKHIADEKVFYGIGEPYEEGEVFSYMAGVEVNAIEEVPEGMQVWYLNHQDYLVMVQDLKEQKTLAQGFNEIYGELLEELGLWATEDYDYELYTEDFYNEEPGKVYLHVPVTRK